MRVPVANKHGDGGGGIVPTGTGTICSVLGLILRDTNAQTRRLGTFQEHTEGVTTISLLSSDNYGGGGRGIRTLSKLGLKSTSATG